jgi:hypothetical protein
MSVSYSQAGQDLFALCVVSTTPFTQPFRTYLEVGANHPTHFSNNTYALEQNGWKGLSSDIESRFAPIYVQQRQNPFVVADATTVKWVDLISQHSFFGSGEPYVIDYLSFDIDDATIPGLMNMPFDKLVFKCITIEHDKYRVGDHIQTQIRTILQKHGYRLLCSDVHVTGLNFEDWWIHPDHVSYDKVKYLECDGQEYTNILSRRP